MNLILKKKFNLTRIEETIVHEYYRKLLEHFTEGEKALKYVDLDGYKDVFDDFNTLTKTIVKGIKVDHKSKCLTINFIIDGTSW